MGDYNAQLFGIKNPETDKTLSEENRWVSSTEENGKLTITYNRDGIGIDGKKTIEAEIVYKFEGIFSDENILVKTVSQVKTVSKVKPESATPKENTDAQLKVGHGVNAGKKRIVGAKNVVAISSCKGGVGKSTVTVNLATTLAKRGYRVGLIDADIYGPSTPILLGKRGAKPESTKDKKIKPLLAHGIKFISFGLFIEEDKPVIWRGPMLGGVLNQFFFDTDWGELDYLLIDLPPGTGDVQLSMVQNTEVDGVIVISTPQELALADTRKGIEMFAQVNIPVVGLVENMSYFSPPDQLDQKYYIFGEGGVKKTAEKLGIPFLGEIPLEIGLRESSDAGVPYMTDHQNEGKPVFKSYLDLADKMDKIFLKKEKSFLQKIFKK